MSIDSSIYQMFKKVGKHLVRHGYNTSHSGNISIKSGGKIIIKRRAAMLGNLEPEDLVICNLKEEDSGSLIASTELGVHRAIYLETDAMAVIHAHNPYCVALSLIEDEITCIDAEGFALYKKIPLMSSPKEDFQKFSFFRVYQGDNHYKGLDLRHEKVYSFEV